MATINLILDERRAKKNGTFPVKLIIRHNQKYTYIPTKYSIKPSFWVNGLIKKGCKDVDNVKLANNKLSALLVAAEDILEQLEKRSKVDRMDAKQIAEVIKNDGQKISNISFNQYLSDYLPIIKNKSTRDKYENTYKAISKYQKESVYFDEINKA